MQGATFVAGCRTDHGVLADIGRATLVDAKPDKLTYRQRFRLIEIAHETHNERIRAAAVALLVEGS